MVGDLLGCRRRPVPRRTRRVLRTERRPPAPTTRTPIGRRCWRSPVTSQALDILDVGCGAGHYAAELLARGARVTGIDASATLLRHAHKRAAQAQLRLHDLERPLDFAADASFDGVVCALVIQPSDEPAAVAHRDASGATSRPAGSSSRPPIRRLTGDTSAAPTTTTPGSTYRYGPGALHFQRMTLETFLGELLDAGFLLEKLVEPRPAHRTPRGRRRRVRPPHRTAVLRRRPNAVPRLKTGACSPRLSDLGGADRLRRVVNPVDRHRP